MASTLKVDNIIATDGTTAPITLSGDTATLGSGVTFPTGGMFNFKKTIVDGANVSVTTSSVPFESTIHGSHSHQFKTTDAQVVITCISSTRLYESATAGGAFELNGKFSLRHSEDNYGSNLVTNGIRHLYYASSAHNNRQLAGSLVVQWIYTPTRSVGDTITYKLYMTTNTNVDYIDTSTTGNKVIWTSYEVAV